MQAESIILSIVIPTFNSGKSLKEALGSIINQTFTNYEILIIDNLSEDNTLEILNDFSSLHDNIRWISEPDKGIYDAMNKGIKLAKGNWIFFLGSDDKLFNSNVLQLIIDEISNNDYDVIYGDVYSTRFCGRYDGEFNYLKIMSQNICHQAIFFKKTVFKKTGLFNLRYKSHADWDHNMHWFLSPAISKMYYNCIIAEYADGGFSSLTNDPKFENERILKYLIYGKSRFPINYRISLLKQELKRTAQEHNKYLFLKLALNIPRIITGV